ncbi:MAG: hypothetical protein HQL94_08940, partial [Magnetococcales bacterium]|nr:hypothetical protein [Magnetococcales bacterium]
VFVTGIVGYSYINYTKFGVFSVTGTRGLPVYNFFHFNKAMSPANGPASARLAELVEQHLLPQAEYKNYGITMEKFFSIRHKYFCQDLHFLTGQYAPGLLEQTYWESFVRHPKQVIKIVYNLLEWGLTHSFSPEINAQCLPNVPESSSTLVSTYTQPPGHYYSESDLRENPTPADIAEKADKLVASTMAMMQQVTPSCATAEFLNRYLLGFPMMSYFWVFTIPLLLMYRVVEFRLLYCLLLPGGAIAVISMVSQSPLLQYRMPFDFLFILSGILGMIILMEKLVTISKAFKSTE